MITLAPLRACGVAIVTIVVVSIPAAFAWLIVNDAEINTSAVTSPEVFVGMLAVSALAPLPLTLPAALLGGLVAGALVNRQKTHPFRGSWMRRGAVWGCVLGGGYVLGGWFVFTGVGYEQVRALAQTVPIGAFLGAISGIVVGAYCERLLESTSNAG
jgi:hypothetical protein